MKRKYSVITGFLGKIQDRFCDYQPPRSLDEMVEMAAGIKGCSGIEVVYPQNLKDCDHMKNLLDRYHLGVSTVNLNVKSEEKFRYGSFSCPDKKIRREAVEYLKTAMDYAADLGCNLVTSAFLTDGSDYPFELDYVKAFQDALEGVKEAANYRKDVRISLEYKASEPRAHCLLNNAGKMGYFCSLVGSDNVGVTLDIGHAFQAQEVPADSIAFLGATNKLFYVHVNDNYRIWDWDMLPGTVNLWEYLEAVLYLKRVGYDNWITADVFPQRYNPVKMIEKTFEWMDYLFEIVDRIDEDMLFEKMHEIKDFEALDYIRSLLSK